LLTKRLTVLQYVVPKYSLQYKKLSYHRDGTHRPHKPNNAQN